MKNRGTKQRLFINVKTFSLLPMLAFVAVFLFMDSAHAVARAKPEQSASTQIQSFKNLPPGAAPAIVQAMQKELPTAYQLQETDLGFAMSNTSHGLQIAFASEGPQITTGGKSWGMSMTGIGYQGSVKPAHKARLVNDDGRLVYERGSVSEWYINSQWGVEQGFTVQKAPSGNRDNELVVKLALSGELQPSLDSNTLVLSDASGKSVVRYTGLQVFDANGSVLTARLALAGSSLRILVNDSNAKYPITIDPWIQAAKLTASDAAVNNRFGYSVSISSNTIVIGAVGDNSYTGSAYVFVKPVEGWANMTETVKLTASDGVSGDNFGSSVSISDDTIVVGAQGDDSYAGSAYVFVKPAGGWTNMTETAKLTASNASADDYFGYSVSISGDTIVAGAYYGDGNTAISGSAYVFVKPGTDWTTTLPATLTETAKLTASDGDGYDQFGRSVSISGDMIVVGAFGDDDNGDGSGSAYVFVKPGAVWTTMIETAKLNASDGDVSDQFGNSVSISGDTIVVGANLDDNNGNDSGSAYIFVKPGAGWTTMTETAKLTASDGATDDHFGNSVSINNGDTIVVGAFADDDNGSGSGSAYIFVKPGAGWSTMTQTAKLKASDGAANDEFGYSVSISGDTIVVGARYDDDNGAESGSAYVMEFSFPWPMFLPAITNNAKP